MKEKRPDSELKSMLGRRDGGKGDARRTGYLLTRLVRPSRVNCLGGGRRKGPEGPESPVLRGLFPGVYLHKSLVDGVDHFSRQRAANTLLYNAGRTRKNLQSHVSVCSIETRAGA